MDVCSWDWGAIATFTGVGAAIWISNQWRNQKGSDVLSNLSKDTYFLMEELIIIIKDVYEDNRVFIIQNFKSEIDMSINKKKLNNIIKQINGNLELIYRKTNDDRIIKSIKYIDDNISKFNSSPFQLSFINKFRPEFADENDKKDTLIEMLNIVDRFERLIIEIKNEILTTHIFHEKY